MAISTRQVKNKRDSNGVLTGRPGTVYDVNIKYTAPNGEKKTYSKKGFPTKKEATQHEAEMKAKLHNPGQIASIASQRKQTVASYLNEWVESYARVNLRPSTYDGYKRTPLTFPSSYPLRYRQKQKSLRKWHRRNPTGESCLSQSLPARSFSNSLLCRKRSANRQKRTESLTMTMTLL